MKRVAVFGNTGGGKSTLARRLAGITRLPFDPLDLIEYRVGGGKVTDEEYLKAHAELLRLLTATAVLPPPGSVSQSQTRWSTSICLSSHITGGVTKRLMKGLFINPEGWPQGSPIWRGIVNSFKVVWLCHSRLTPKYRQLVAEMSASKRVHHLKSATDMRAFFNAIKSEYASG